MDRPCNHVTCIRPRISVIPSTRAWASTRTTPTHDSPSTRHNTKGRNKSTAKTSWHHSQHHSSSKTPTISSLLIRAVRRIQPPTPRQSTSRPRRPRRTRVSRRCRLPLFIRQRSLRYPRSTRRSPRLPNNSHSLRTTLLLPIPSCLRILSPKYHPTPSTAPRCRPILTKVQKCHHTHSSRVPKCHPTTNRVLKCLPTPNRVPKCHPIPSRVQKCRPIPSRVLKCRPTHSKVPRCRPIRRSPLRITSNRWQRLRLRPPTFLNQSVPRRPAPSNRSQKVFIQCLHLPRPQIRRLSRRLSRPNPNRQTCSQPRQLPCGVRQTRRGWKLLPACTYRSTAGRAQPSSRPLLLLSAPQPTLCRRRPLPRARRQQQQRPPPPPPPASSLTLSLGWLP